MIVNDKTRLQAKAKAWANKIFIVLASLMIGTNNCQNIFMVQTTKYMNSREPRYG
jgi:hypothetical protein